MSSLHSIYLYCAIDLISIAIIGIIFVYGHLLNKNLPEHTVFNVLLLVSLITQLADAATWIFDGAAFTGHLVVQHLFTMVFYGSMVLSSCLWVAYCDCKIYNDNALSKRMPFYLIPFFLFVVWMFINLQTGWLYYFDANNIYNRGPAYISHLVCIAIPIVYSVFLICKHAPKQNAVRRHDIYSLLLFVVAPILGASIQGFFYGVSLGPCSVVISLLILFVQRQAALITVDSMTGLNNHRAFEQHLEMRLRSRAEDQVLFLAIIDANFFKSINDTYGHAVGNAALIRIGALLRQACSRGDFLARIGGDEFVILGQRETLSDTKDVARTIEALVEQENASGNNMFKLSLSVGTEIYDPELYPNADAFLHAADTKMYQRKRELHLALA